MFDPEAFGAAMGDLIRDAVAPLVARIGALEAVDVKQVVASAVSAMPRPADGKDALAVDVDAIVKRVVELIPKPVDGKDGINGKDGTDAKGDKGDPGKDGLGLAGAMIDRDGALQITLTNGEVRSLGKVVGKDGSDGADGISFDSFELEYLPESHEMAVKATVGTRTKELRFPAGGIRPAGYWREGTKAKTAEAWVHDGSTWFAVRDTTSKPESKGDDWIIAARKGRDGETTVKTINAGPPVPIKLQA